MRPTIYTGYYIADAVHLITMNWSDRPLVAFGHQGTGFTDSRCMLWLRLVLLLLRPAEQKKKTKERKQRNRINWIGLEVFAIAVHIHTLFALSLNNSIHCLLFL